MSVSVSDFWKLVCLSRLLTRQECQQLNERFRSTKSANFNAKELAKWLISENKVTTYQAQTLLAGIPGPFVFGDYRIQSKMSGGDTIRQFRARHLPTDHRVILHFMSDPSEVSDTEWLACRRLALRHQKLVHANLDHCYETITRTTHKIAVSEDLKGTRLRAVIETEKRVPIPAACEMIRQAALGLQALHHNQMIHGFVHPDWMYLQPNRNVRLQRCPIFQPAAVDLSVEDTKGNLADRANYLAPELASPNTVLDERTDVYALGCAFYELLTGHPPFEGGRVDEKMIRHAREPIRPLSEFIPVPENLNDIVSFMMAKNYNLRLKSKEVVQRLEPFAAHSIAYPAVVRSTEKEFRTMLANDLAEKSMDPAEQIPEDTNASPPHPVHTPKQVAPSQDDSPVEQKLSSIRPTTTLRKRSSVPWGLITLILGILGIGVIVIVLMALLNRNNDSSLRDRDRSTITPSLTHDVSNDSQEDAPNAVSKSQLDSLASGRHPDSQTRLVRDDGVSLWKSPTSGQNMNTAFLSPATQCILSLNWKRLLESDEGAHVMRALGPELDTWLSSWQFRLGIKMDQIDHLLIGLSPSDTGPPQATYVVQFREGFDAKKAVQNGNRRASKFGLVVEINSNSVFLPVNRNTWIIANQQHIERLSSDSPPKPLLRRSFEWLIEKSDSDRHVTIVTSVHFLAVGSGDLFSGRFRPIQQTLLNIIGDDSEALMLSFHVEENFFGELTVTSKSEKSVRDQATEMRTRIANTPSQLSAYLGTANVHRYWQRLAVQYPMMVQSLVKHTRVVPFREGVMVNFVLPAQAAHNLVLASEVSLAAAPKQTVAKTPKEYSIDEVLQWPMTYQFGQQSLEFAIAEFKDRINEELPGANVDMRILGADLQLDGITRNQQIKDFSMANAACSDILTKIVMMANPNTTVKLPSENDQSLIWVKNPDQSSGISLLITTRTAAAQKGYELPSRFIPKTF